MATVTVKPILKEARLGLEKRNLTRYPGTKYYVEAMWDDQYNKRRIAIPEQEQAELEKTLNVSLDSRSDFWESYRVALEDKINTFDTSNPKHALAIHVMRSSPYVANSEDEMSGGKWPEAIYVMNSPEEEISAKLDKTERKLEAFRRLNDLTPTKRKWVATSIFYKSFENMSNENTPKVLLSDYIEKGKKEVENFLDVTASKDEVLEADYLLTVFTIHNVLRKSGDRFMRGDTEYASSKQAAIDKLVSPTKQEERMQMELELKAKTNK